MTAVVWTLLAVILGALVTFGVEIRRSIGALDAKFDARIGALDAKFDARIDALDAELRVEMGRVVRTQQRMAGSLDVLVRMAHTHHGPGDGAAGGPTPSPA
jgi:hypothetical protein